MFDFKINQEAKQSQQLLLSLSMQQALHVLQLPIVELAEWLETQIEENPLLEKKEDDISCEEETELETSIEDELLDIADSSEEIKTSHSDSLECIRMHQDTLFEHMMNQASQICKTQQEFHIAEQIIGSLDERGFLTIPLEEIFSEELRTLAKEVLAKIQELDPPGIAARSLQESLLLQLISLGKKETLAYWIVENHFGELLEQKYSFIEKKCKCSSAMLQNALKEDISSLDPYPGSRFQICYNMTLVPDIYVRKEGSVWKIEINDEMLPRFKLSSQYEELFPSFDTKEKSYVKKQLSSAKWLAKMIQRRNQTLLEIAKYIVKKQGCFFDTDGKELLPMSMQEIAQEISVHESTVARAVANKYLSSPLGIFSLRSFFSQSINKSCKDISNESAKKMLQKIVREENKRKPLSDTELVHKLNRMGFCCARRTITKYRKALHIAPSHKRKIS